MQVQVIDGIEVGIDKAEFGCSYDGIIRDIFWSKENCFIYFSVKTGRR